MAYTQENAEEDLEAVYQEIEELRREQQRLKREMKILLDRNGGLSEAERIMVEA